MSEQTNVFIHTIHRSALNVTGNHINIISSELNEYPERAFFLVAKDDYIILNHLPDKDYLDYLINIGLGTRNILIPSIQGDTLSDRIQKDKQLLAFLRTLTKVVLQPYISTQAEIQLAKKINATVNGSPPSLTHKVNNKLYLPVILQKLALPVPEHQIANSLSVIETAKAWKAKYKKIIIIGEHSYGGFAVWPIKNENDLNALDLQQCKNQEQFLVEKMYDVLYSVNIQYNIGVNIIQILGLTDQILDNQLKHQGNIYPSSATQIEKIKHYSHTICEELQSQGYRGLLGIDLIETIEGEVFAVDINGRANASSFGLYVIRQLFPDSQKHFKILTHLKVEPKTTFTTLKHHLGKKTLFDRESGRGILPYNIGFLQWGKFSAIVIGNTQQEVEQLIHEKF